MVNNSSPIKFTQSLTNESFNRVYNSKNTHYLTDKKKKIKSKKKTKRSFDSIFRPKNISHKIITPRPVENRVQIVDENKLSKGFVKIKKARDVIVEDEKEASPINKKYTDLILEILLIEYDLDSNPHTETCIAIIDICEGNFKEYINKHSRDISENRLIKNYFMGFVQYFDPRVFLSITKLIKSNKSIHPNKIQNLYQFLKKMRKLNLDWNSNIKSSWDRVIHKTLGNYNYHSIKETKMIRSKSYIVGNYSHHDKNFHRSEVVSYKPLFLLIDMDDSSSLYKFIETYTRNTNYFINQVSFRQLLFKNPDERLDAYFEFKNKFLFTLFYKYILKNKEIKYFESKILLFIEKIYSCLKLTSSNGNHLVAFELYLFLNSYSLTLLKYKYPNLSNDIKKIILKTEKYDSYYKTSNKFKNISSLYGTSWPIEKIIGPLTLYKELSSFKDCFEESSASRTFFNHNKIVNIGRCANEYENFCIQNSFGNPVKDYSLDYITAEELENFISSL